MKALERFFALRLPAAGRAPLRGSSFAGSIERLEVLGPATRIRGWLRSPAPAQGSTLVQVTSNQAVIATATTGELRLDPEGPGMEFCRDGFTAIVDRVIPREESRCLGLRAGNDEIVIPNSQPVRYIVLPPDHPEVLDGWLGHAKRLLEGNDAPGAIRCLGRLLLQSPAYRAALDLLETAVSLTRVGTDNVPTLHLSSGGQSPGSCGAREGHSLADHGRDLAVFRCILDELED